MGWCVRECVWGMCMCVWVCVGMSVCECVWDLYVCVGVCETREVCGVDGEGVCRVCR